jgi:hypothetical protein
MAFSKTVGAGPDRPLATTTADHDGDAKGSYPFVNQSMDAGWPFYYYMPQAK